MRPSRAELVVLGLLLVSAHGARGQAIGQGFELERAGQYQRAATVYFTTLRGEPTNLAALLGLERVLPSLSRLPELLPAAPRAVAASPGNAALRIVRAILAPEPKPLERRLAGELLLGWGQPERAWSVFAPAVAEPSSDAATALRRFADLANGGNTPDARRVRALALARYADMVPEPLAVRARAEAARAFLGAGDRVAARRVLAQVAADSTAPPDAQALAQSALVEALIDDGQLSEAATRLGAESRLSEDDRAALRLKLARARIQRGELDLADSVLLADSSVDALALRGWVALYSGDMKEAQEMFRAAGPYAGDRRDATERSGVLALLQQLPGDRFPELGSALLLLARGDSARAVQSLRLAAARLETRGSGGEGRADILLLAGRVAVRLDALQQQTALTLFAEVAGTPGKSAAAPAAELEWARLLLRQLKTAEAIAHLEHLILAYPESAVVPEARRELERAKGAIPKS